MRISLSAKIIGSFSLIVLLSLGTAVGMGNRIIRNRYDEYSYQMDVNRARGLARMLGSWTAGADEGATEVPLPILKPLITPFSPDFMDDEGPESHHGDRDFMDLMMDRMAGPRTENSPDLPGIDRMVITDMDGKVLLDTADYGKSELNPENRQPVEIRNGRTPVGYIYWGRMVPGIDPAGDISFFRSAGRIVWFFTAFIFLFAMGLALLLTRNIIGPVKRLNRAASEVESGDLSVRVPENRNDELGDLSRGFNSMTASLEHEDYRRRRLIADSAHELRTPVSLIRARIEMMEEGIYPMDADGLAALSEESGRLVRLVGELRILADLESPETSLMMESVDPVLIIGEVIKAAGPDIDRKGIDVEVITGDGGAAVPGTCKGDSEKLHRLLSNLLSNALRYADSRILISLEAAVEGVVIRVEDDGSGIPEEHRDRVFDRYFRVDASRSRDSGGSGLGLAICREIAMAHGGSIRTGVSRRLGGAAFTVILPIQ